MKARILAAISAAAVAVPLAAATSAPALASTTHELTVKVIDRAGHAGASTHVELVNVGSGANIHLGTTRQRSLRPGTYNVAAWIITGSGHSATFTLADKIIDLNASKRVVLDARQGKLVRLHLNNSSAVAETLEVAPIVNGSDWAFNPTTIAPPVGKTYLIPMHSSLMRLYVYSIWEKKGNSATNPSPFRYDIMRVYAGHIPSSPVISTRTSQLTRIDVTVRNTAPAQQSTLQLTPMPPSGPVLPMNATTTLGPTPARLVSYRTPGWEWEPMVNWTTGSGYFRDWDLDQAADGRGRHTEVWGAAVFGPDDENGAYVDIENRRLQVGDSSFPMSDPLHPSDEGTATQKFQLYTGGKLLKKSAGGTVNVTIPRATREYSFHLTATTPASDLSTRVTGVWTFPAHGGGILGHESSWMYSLNWVARGLSARNQAGSHSVTTVALRAYPATYPYPKLARTIKVWASSDDGATWHRVTVHTDGSLYLITVRNSASAGYTSLKVYLSDGHGHSEDLTVIHAYGVR
jgi:hypothetical protein